MTDKELAQKLLDLAEAMLNPIGKVICQWCGSNRTSTSTGGNKAGEYHCDDCGKLFYPQEPSSFTSPMEGKELATALLTLAEELMKTEQDEEALTYDDLLGNLDIKADGIGVMDDYMSKYFPNAQGEVEVLEGLESFLNDLSEYAIPAATKMIDSLGGSTYPY